MTFEATVKDQSGARRTVRREAESREALLAALRAGGYLVIDAAEVREAPELPPRWSPAWLRPMTCFDVEMGFRQIASMLKSGVSLLQALATVQAQSPGARAKQTWKAVREHVFRGGTFADALAGHPRRFDEMAVRLAEVGEKTGELERSLSRTADQMEARRNLRAAVVNALLYPVIAVLLAIGVSTYLVVAVIPKVAEFLKSGGTDLPAMTQALMDFSAWVVANGPVILAATGGALAAWFAVRMNETGRELEDVVLMKTPVTGRILRLSGTALFARSMQIMTEAGVPLVDALATGGRLLANRRLRRRVANAREAVMRGSPLAKSLAPAVEFMPMLASMAAVGETGGALPEAFGETARFHEMLLAVAVKRFGMLMEPVMILVTGGMVGFVYIAFFMAIFAIAGTN